MHCSELTLTRGRCFPTDSPTPSPSSDPEQCQRASIIRLCTIAKTNNKNTTSPAFKHCHGTSGPGGEQSDTLRSEQRRRARTRTGFEVESFEVLGVRDSAPLLCDVDCHVLRRALACARYQDHTLLLESVSNDMPETQARVWACGCMPRDMMVGGLRGGGFVVTGAEH
eukprot:3941284-Rhodomonas_salina.3